MLKQGDEIVCVNIEVYNKMTFDSYYDDDMKYPDVCLELYKTYIIRKTFITNSDNILLNDIYGVFNVKRFISLKEYRKQKLKKLNEHRKIQNK